MIKLNIKNLRIQVISDIHLELRKRLPKKYLVPEIKPVAEVLCLCGDIGYPFDKSYAVFIDNVAKAFSWVFVIAGNHEFYDTNYTMSEHVRKIKEVCDTVPNVTFLNNESVIAHYGENSKIKIIGSTLWSDVSKNEDMIGLVLNDYRLINVGARMPLTTEKVCKMHNIAVEYIKEELKYSEIENKKTLVLTHHLPSFGCIHQDFKYGDVSLLNAAYASSLDRLIRKPVVAWIHGHSHRHTDIVINGIRVVCNPMGYVSENSVGFDENMVIDV